MIFLSRRRQGTRTFGGAASVTRAGALAWVLISCGAGCGGGGGGGGSTDTRASATVNVYHTLVADSGATGAIDFSVNGAKVGAETPYGSGSLNQILRWNPAKPELFTRFTPNNDPQRTLFQTLLLLDAGKTFTLFLVGESDRTDTARPDLVILPRPETFPAAGFFRLRFLHSLPETGPLDIYMTSNDADLQKVASNLTFRDVSDNFLIPPASSGLWRVIVTPTGVPPKFPLDGDLLNAVLPAAATPTGHSYIDALTHESGSVQSGLASLLVVEQ